MRLKRKHKIIVACANDKIVRQKLLCELLVDAEFARITSDAMKICKSKIDDCNLDNAFFVAVSDFNFSSSHVITHRLLRMALQGIPVFVAAKNVPNQFIQFCEISYPESL